MEHNWLSLCSGPALKNVHGEPAGVGGGVGQGQLGPSVLPVTEHWECL